MHQVNIRCVLRQFPRFDPIVHEVRILVYRDYFQLFHMINDAKYDGKEADTRHLSLSILHIN